MTLWKTPISLTTIQERSKNTMSEFLGITFIEIGDRYLKASMPVDHRTKQPIGIMHGGASCVLAETVGSVAANFALDLSLEYCVGLDINTNHIRRVTEGIVIGTATPFHIGKRTHVWEILIHDEKEQLISVNRLTMAVMPREQKGV